MMKRRITAIAALVLAASQAMGGPSSQVAWTPATMQLIQGGDPARGQTLAASCGGCHGAEGLSAIPQYPHLAGQLADYHYKQLRDYKDATRINMIMRSMVAALSDQDMADLAAFYASFPLSPPKSTEADLSAAEVLVKSGDGKRLIPACNACHEAPHKRRHHGVALLEGQSEAYFKQTLEAYKNGTRANDVYSVMRSIAGKLTPAEIDALAAYYAGLDHQ